MNEKKERFWFVVAEYETASQTGKASLGFVSDDAKPFTNKAVKQAFMDHNKEFDKVMIINFIEFKDENDYINFWRK